MNNDKVGCISEYWKNKLNDNERSNETAFKHIQFSCLV